MVAINDMNRDELFAWVADLLADVVDAQAAPLVLDEQAA